MVWPTLGLRTANEQSKTGDLVGGGVDVDEQAGGHEELHET